ncbi:hypothetical protein GIX45_29255 [Erwinia sp. CPCC 100877]|nr:hypothetical protein [Erwinia sp. CPCC 100877]
MKTFVLSLLCLASSAYAEGEYSNDITTYPYCMNIPHTPEVTACMMDVTNQKKKEYQNAFAKYLKYINPSQERPYDKTLVASLANKARKNWDAYIINECLAEASVYEKDSYGYSAAYNICLTIRYDTRIKYYKNNTH